MELQGVDNDNHKRASGILSQDVFVGLHLHSSSEVLHKNIKEKCLVGLGEFETVMQTRRTRDEVEGLHNYREFSQPLECLYQDMQTQEKSFLLLL